MANEPSNATEGPRWLPRAERFVRRALLAELAFVDLHRVGFFYPSLGNSEEMANSTFPYSIAIVDRDFLHSNSLTGKQGAGPSSMRGGGWSPSRTSSPRRPLGSLFPIPVAPADEGGLGNISLPNRGPSPAQSPPEK